MSMVNCSECGHSISSEAEVCPHCGLKTQHGKQESEKKVLSNALIVDLFISIIGSAIFLFGFITMMDDISNYNDLWANGYNYKSPLSEHEIGIILLMVFGILLNIVGSVWYSSQKNSKK